MDVIAVPIIKVLITMIDMYRYVVIIAIIISWLSNFGIINTYNSFVMGITNFVHRMTEPALSRIRSILPRSYVIDFSPLILILSLIIISSILNRILIKLY